MTIPNQQQHQQSARVKIKNKTMQKLKSTTTTTFEMFGPLQQHQQQTERQYFHRGQTRDALTVLQQQQQGEPLNRHQPKRPQQQRKLQQLTQQQRWQHFSHHQWLVLSVVMLTLFTVTIEGITEELSPGKCVCVC